ncbi:hypothetical protein P7K49_001807 [Saguinus oedipus]|uniref:Uncharacterized protein n=1 Tax=Saguinus oedipus TaxID=9490 RepID=A0ABQ9WFJ6_SAGOE|nr:hypothetical protein P7K49_001807 [Saguinus oedipus]
MPGLNPVSVPVWEGGAEGWSGQKLSLGAGARQRLWGLAVLSPPRWPVLLRSLQLWNDEVDKAEQELRVAQTEFDRQAEVTRLLLEGISSTHVSLSPPKPSLKPAPQQVNHLRCLHEFVKSQTTYYAQCYRHMLDLQKQLGRCGWGQHH